MEKFGFVRVATASPKVKVADCINNANNIIDEIRNASYKNVQLIVFPELCITAYTCGDLFLQDTLINSAKDALRIILQETRELSITIVVGLPIDFDGKLYNCGVAIYKGTILGIVPKTYLPNYNEFYEKRHFEPAFNGVKQINILEQTVCFGTSLIFKVSNKSNMIFAIEICEDLWAPIPPSSYNSLAGANIIVNLSAGNEIAGKSIYRKELVKNQSARNICAYLYACAGEGESTTDVVFSGHNLICENGRVLGESNVFLQKENHIYTDVDLFYINSERRKNTSFRINNDGYITVSYEMDISQTKRILRFVDKAPFIPNSNHEIDKRCEEIINIQAFGLKKRIEHIGNKNVVIGISGGLDSTYALLVVNRAYDILGYDKKGIITVTMPCFGTTDRTYQNAIKLCNCLETTLLEIDIKDSVLKHFEDIGHDKDVHDLTYENSQARERTQILMDISSRYNGFVVGTGDLSELALGFATYNGDHMSMYGVNNSIPKTLIRYLIKYFSDTSKIDTFKNILNDVLNTPVSPELLPPTESGDIKQVTEDIVGPYELHDFFLYNIVRNTFEPKKVFYLACQAFEDDYNRDTILKWLEKFYYRFFSNQFKRSCMPDGPKVGSISLSPRGDFRMPSDASYNIWINQLQEIKEANNKSINFLGQGTDII